MSHFSHNADIATHTTAEWLPVGASIGRLVNTWSFRDDLAVMVAQGTVSGAPAAFNPATAEIEVDISKAFGNFVDPKTIGDFAERMTQLEYPVASGAIFHEALHARFSRWSMPDAHNELVARGNAKDFNALMALEEGRIEAWGVRTSPQNRVLLRSCAMEIVYADLVNQLDKISSVTSVASLCSLTYARVDAGVLDSEDVEPLNAIIEEHLGNEVFEALRSVWIRFQAIENHSDYLPMLELAREWNSILENLKGDKEGGDEEGGEGEGGEGEGGEGGEGQPSKGKPGKGDQPLSPEQIEEILDAIKDLADDISISNAGDIDDAQQKEEWSQEVNRRGERAQQQKAKQDLADEVFGRGNNDGPIAGKSKSVIQEVRKPLAQERAAAVRVGQALEKAKYRERSQTEVASILPPGRLRTRAVVQGAALKAQGSIKQVEAWRQTKRKHTDDPTLNVGVMVDISGSMRSAMQPMASTAWVLSEAVRRIQGRAGMVYFGQDVFATLKPGQHLTDVTVWTAADGTEEFGKGFKALDGAMNLSYGEGARMLVIVSDGHYRDDQRGAAKRLLAQADKDGVAILWLDFGAMGNYAKNILRGTDAKIVAVAPDTTPADIAIEIGKASAEALERVGKRNA